MERTEGETMRLAALRHLAAEIGADPHLVQGAGGNVSLKAGDIMWIKASGTWLAAAERQDIMVPVVLPLDPEGEPSVALWDTSGLRPSIETSMHAALPHAVVLHVHSVDAIALAVRTDAVAKLTHRLDGLNWEFVPYARPGLPLTHAIQRTVAGKQVDVLVLGNHGLVVGAPDVAAADALLRDVAERLAVTPRATDLVPADISARTRGTGFRPVGDAAIHALATDARARAIAEGGVLYPDHVVFLGSSPLGLDPDADLAAALADCAARGEPRPKWLLLRGQGVAIAEDAARGAEEMLGCLANVAARIPADAPIAFLSAQDLSALTGWDAEKYRQQLARN